ncbi:Dynein heavy chain 3, axonemal [Eumeta japonica]|uniref:Dynein heavy chain 3, axonemal n=1 Tax=Eumeta variegata TaxID=151549 RepID=A0A4C1XIS0_EUMVA|nr:Dynein heavy chain 3, axonemal [Eumeta japonica]
MLEDVNMLLNTGDIPNLYGMEEKVEILDKMQAAVRESGRKMETTPLAMFGFFIERVKASLRVALAMSPIGDAFRNRLRMFPSLINCCTIDWYYYYYKKVLNNIGVDVILIIYLPMWFTAWPPEALERVAQMFVGRMESLSADLRSACVSMCRLFHVSVVKLGERFSAYVKSIQRTISYKARVSKQWGAPPKGGVERYQGGRNTFAFLKEKIIWRVN